MLTLPTETSREEKMTIIDVIYQCCENLWEELNIWFKELGIEYTSEELPF